MKSDKKIAEWEYVLKPLKPISLDQIKNIILKYPFCQSDLEFHQKDCGYLDYPERIFVEIMINGGNTPTKIVDYHRIRIKINQDDMSVSLKESMKALILDLHINLPAEMWIDDFKLNKNSVIDSIDKTYENMNQKNE